MVDIFNWICGWIQMNSLMNFNEFVNEFKSICWWIHWRIQMNSLMNLLMNSSEFIKESKWIHWGNSPAQNPLFSQNINFFLLIKQNLLEILILDSAFAESWLCRRVFCFCRRKFSFSRIEFWFFRIKFCFLGTSSW